jgi:hypothetical protein
MDGSENLANKVLNLNEILELDKPEEPIGLRVATNDVGWMHVTGCKNLSTYDVEVECGVEDCQVMTHIALERKSLCEEHLIDKILSHVRGIRNQPSLQDRG